MLRLGEVSMFNGFGRGHSTAIGSLELRLSAVV